MALRAAKRKLAELEREARRRERAGSKQPTKRFFHPDKPDSAFCEFAHRAGGVDFYAPRPQSSAAGGNSALRPFDEASHGGKINALSLTGDDNDVWRTRAARALRAEVLEHRVSHPARLETGATLTFAPGKTMKGRAGGRVAVVSYSDAGGVRTQESKVLFHPEALEEFRRGMDPVLYRDVEILASEAAKLSPVADV